MIDISTQEISFETKGFNHIMDLTPRVQKSLEESDFDEGQIFLFIPGSTGGLTTIEFEPGLLKDFPEFLESIIPMNKSYHHDNTWHDGNGYAHIRSSLIRPFINIPFKKKNLILGTWQQIIFIDFDNKPRRRRLIIQFFGKKVG